MRGSFARFWQHRISTAIQVGNARMFDRWLRRQHDQLGAAEPTAPPHLPDDLAEMISTWADTQETYD